MSGSGKAASRQTISSDELCKLINDELAQYEVSGSCKLIAVQELLLVNGTGCNWEPCELQGRNRGSAGFLPVFANVIQAFRAWYNVR